MQKDQDNQNLFCCDQNVLIRLPFTEKSLTNFIACEEKFNNLIWLMIAKFW